MQETVQNSLDAPDAPNVGPNRVGPNRMGPNRIRQNAPRIVIVVVLVTLACVLLFSGVLNEVTIDGVVEEVRGAGAWGIVGFIVSFAALQPVGVSAHIFTAAAGLIWAPLFAVLIALTGAVLAACGCFLVARFVAYDWVRTRLSKRLLRYEDWLFDHGLWSMIVVRALTYTSQPVLFMMGTTRVKFGTMLLGTIVGFVPMVCLGVFLGGEILRAVAEWF